MLLAWLPADPESAQQLLLGLGALAAPGGSPPQLSGQPARARGAQQIRDDHRESGNTVWMWFGTAHPGPTSTEAITHSEQQG